MSRLGVWGCMYGSTGLQFLPAWLVRQSLAFSCILYRTSHPHVLVTFAPKVTRQILLKQTVGRANAPARSTPPFALKTAPRRPDNRRALRVPSISRMVSYGS